MTNKEARERLERGDFTVIDALPLKQLYLVAELMKADTSGAKRLRGVGFQYDALKDAIRAVISQTA